MRRRRQSFRNAWIAIRASPGGASTRYASRGVVSDAMRADTARADCSDWQASATRSRSLPSWRQRPPSTSPWKSAAALRALDQVAAGVIISDGDGRVVEMNRAAEHVLRRDDGLTVRQGMLFAQRVFDHEKLARTIAVAADGKTA